MRIGIERRTEKKIEIPKKEKSNKKVKKITTKRKKM